MCGIVGAVAQRNVVPILIEGLRKLEYRGYDSAGLALLDPEGHMNRVRAVGRVAELDTRAKEKHADAPTGIAHTRWATHGGVNEGNAHPHISTGSDLQISVVHNGIIENHEELRSALKAKGYEFTSQTDTEVVAHLVHSLVLGGLSLTDAVAKAIKQLHGRRGPPPRLAPAAGRGRRRFGQGRELPRLRHLGPAAGHQARHLPGRR